MSRIGASFGGSVGFVAGAVAGTYANGALRRGTFGFHGGVSGETALLGGAFAGALIGAAIGAGGAKQAKQVGTSGTIDLGFVGGFP